MKKQLSNEIRAFIEKQIEILERLSDSFSEFESEYYELKNAYIENAVDALIVYANKYGVFDEIVKINKKEKAFFLIEPIRKNGKISVDAYGVRCLTYYKEELENFLISERVYSLSELRKFVKCQSFDVEDYNEALKAYELLEWKQNGRY